MSLTRYKNKRNFKSTAEPKGKVEKPANELIFVVQKHAASRLHYDFRLELDGVLKSWAVPKGPSMNSADKRLAIMVEDHPFSYKDFEGNIAKGNYGAGNVIVWDNGTYTATEAANKEDVRKKLKAGLSKGHLAILLKGKKLVGEFDLVQLKGKDENAWLLIKKKDSYASDENVLKKNKSVMTHSTLESLEKDPARGKPVFIKPMLAETVKKPFDKKDWVFEIKYDGYRTIAVLDQKSVNLFSRNQLPFNSKFRSIADALKIIKHPAVLDGEVVIEDEHGHSNFQLLQNYENSGKGTLKYYVFDILNLDGNDTTGLSLLERKELLRMLLAKYQHDQVIYSDHILEEGKSFFEMAVKNNLEGIMAKNATSRYHPGKRSSDWLKVKITQQEEAIIVGITEPRGARNYFGAIILARYEGKELKYAGNCGTGFDEASLKDLSSRFKSFYTDHSPLNEKIKITGKVQWIKPKFIASIKYTEITNEGHFRHPVFLGLRVDKNTGEVTTGSKDMENTESENDVEFKAGKTTLKLTNRNKIYFPGDGITKGDVIGYYKEVANIMVPYLKDRPQSMNRFPNGIDKPGFYQKDVDVEKIPSWLKTSKIYSASANKDIDYLVCNDQATLLYMANLGCIEINPWNSTVQHFDNPDWAVIDLDPEKDDFKEVVNTALVVKQLMDELEAECCCKTSGATGLHIYIPLAAKYEYDSVKMFAELIAQKVSARLPKTTTITRTVQKRDHKIYIDFLQNRRGQTLAAPYSVRPKPGATVSAPLEWNEVNNKLSPSQFTIKNMLKRLDKKGDLWKPVLGQGVDIEKIIKKIEGK